MKKVIAVLFGGQSSEHEISCISAQTVISAINKDRYEVVLVGITKEGKWLFVKNPESIADGTWRESRMHALLSPDSSIHGLLLYGSGSVQTYYVDVVFPVLHGLYGEDGTVQGILELAGIPYVGCGVLASAVSMDKFYTKIIVDNLGIRQAKYVPVYASELTDIDVVLDKVEMAFPYPVFVKPSRSGSSQGVSKAESRGELAVALQTAAEFDRKILVEEMITGREVECAVLGGYTCKASGIGEILAAAEFYDYEAKYSSAESKTIVDPQMDEAVVEQIRTAAVDIFTAVDGFGLSRVDFFVTEQGEVVFNEINTLPGFTAISMYPMLWKARGLSIHELVQQLIDLARTR